MKIENALNHGTKILEKYNIKSAKLDSEILLSKVINEERDFILLNQNNNFKKKQFDNFKVLISQRSKGKPIAHLVGKKDFWNSEFKINNNIEKIKSKVEQPGFLKTSFTILGILLLVLATILTVRGL